MKKINSNLAMLILTVGIWISFLSMEWKVILSGGTMTYLFCSWDEYIVEEQSIKYEHSMKNI
ncbi:MULTISPECIES: hypothetical protein [Enterococcus]|uniref:hypothetical protein n=1 Tax=Enterococcus TaxID=1350 RepID=UPI0008FFF53E|nr:MULTISPECIES: hypothetical protein [Enterococcus]EGP5718376.1 hypothetical protein [Enterococcus faecium]MDF3825996.1 hypothetical protein [Enterococcus faecium]MEB7518583.1 hypothetical protein [Enterococcus hirae]HBI2110783.1 hypothetical protein [Enterococcus faecium]HBI2111801.1 hypothetical protein [Enterococcus faecium]